MTNKGQTVLEYVLLIGIVTLALVYMGTDFKRIIQSAVKLTADQLGNQANADQDFESSERTGILLNSYTNSWNRREHIKNEVGGIVNPIEGDFTQTFTNSYTNVSGPSN